MLRIKILFTIILIAVFLNFFCFSGNFQDTARADGIPAVSINEIAWMGTIASANDEWMELYNSTDALIDLSGWTLAAIDGAPTIDLTGQIAAKSYFLLERTSDETIKDVAADQIYVGSLSNSGEELELKDASGNIIDSVDCTANWYAGDNISKASMERINFSATDPKDNWASNNSLVINGKDAQDNNIIGTPRAKNSVAVDEQAPRDTNQVATTTEQSEEQTTNNSSTSNPSPPIFTINPSDLVINEFLSDPTTGENEWVEIFNNTANDIKLDDYYIEEGSGAKTKLSGTIPAKGFFAVSPVSGNLNNTGDIILLKDKDGRVIDSVAYGNWDDGNINNNAPMANDPNSVARIVDGLNSNNSLADFALSSHPTKNSKNIIESETKIVSPSTKQTTAKQNIVFSEIFPNPAGEDTDTEFIELYNPGSSDIDLTGWEIIDESGKKFTFASSSIRSIIAKNSFFILYRKQSQIALENDKESLKLYEPGIAKAIDSVSYDKAFEGQSYNYSRTVNNYNDSVKEDWTWSEIITPSRFNIIKTPNHPPIADFDCPKNGEVGALISCDGSDSSDEDHNEIKYLWDFGDGATSSLSNASHIYQKIGTYKITLKVFDGMKETSKNISIKITADKKTNANIPAMTASVIADNTGKIIFNELMPNPAGSDVNNEWIELFNTAEEKINLLNWKLKNSSNNNLKISTPVWLEPSAYYLLKNFGAKFSLKNTTDTIKLFNADDELIDTANYSGAVQAASFARQENGKWVWVTRTTPGAKNNFTIIANSYSVAKTKTATKSSAKKSTAKSKKFRRALSLELARKSAVGDLIVTEGTVAVKPGVLGSQYFYIVGSPGLQIYNYNKNFPPLRVGDYVAVSGEISEVNGEKRLKTKTAGDIRIISGQKPPLAETISCEDIDDDSIGKLVKISGEITDKKASTLYIDDGRDETIVYVKASTNISLASVAEGDKIAITGILSKSKNNYRLLPRSEDDIAKLQSNDVSKNPQVLGEASKNSEWTLAERDKKLELFKYLLVIAGGAIVVLVILIVKIYRKKDEA
jgi:DNA/RNA endonuclease YhcR with UshA esterase domain